MKIKKINKEKIRMINTITTQMISVILSVYKTLLYIFICELVVFAGCVICEHEGILSPEPYENVYEAFLNLSSGLQIVILSAATIIGAIYKGIEYIKHDVEENFHRCLINLIWMIVVGFMVFINQLNFISVQQIKEFGKISILVFVLIFISKIIEIITLVPDNRGVVKPYVHCT